MANLEYFLNIRQNNILSYERYKYLKWSLAVIFVCIFLYAVDHPPIKPGGGTVLGYSLGTLGALLILWLLAFGIRKRAYFSTIGTTLGWLSAHVYLGITLVVVVTLHTGFQFGWNIHTLAYALLMLVVLSGLVGVFLYLKQPTLMGNILNGKTLQQFGSAMADIDKQCALLAKNMPKEITELVSSSADAPIFAGRWQRYTGDNQHCQTRRALHRMEHEILPRMYRRSGANQPMTPEMERRVIDIQPKLKEIYTLQFRRLQHLSRIRQFVQLKSWTEVWLIFHVPVSFALLAVLIAHIVSVFYYW